MASTRNLVRASVCLGRLLGLAYVQTEGERPRLQRRRRMAVALALGGAGIAAAAWAIRRANDQSRLPREEAVAAGPTAAEREGGEPRGSTRDQLYEEARRREIPGRSKMTKAELQRALEEAPGP